MGREFWEKQHCVCGLSLMMCPTLPFHRISREESARLVLSQESGSYLVRESSSRGTSCVLTINWWVEPPHGLAFLFVIHSNLCSFFP